MGCSGSPENIDYKNKQNELTDNKENKTKPIKNQLQISKKYNIIYYFYKAY